MNKLYSLDLNLLLVFDAMLRVGSVSRTAEEIGLTQPSTSNALARLRNFFGDPLFVRSDGAMRPTPLALQMAEPVQEALGQLRRAIEDKRHFDPMTSCRRFSICMNEMGQRVFLPKIVTHFAEIAPGVDLEAIEMTSQQAQAAMPNGDVDLVIGYFSDFGPSFFRQRVTTGHYVAVARKGHPHIDGTLTLPAYLNASHISYVPALGNHAALEALLAEEFMKHGVRRRVALRVANSLGIPRIISSTDLIMTIPSVLAQAFCETAPVQVFDLPFDIPDIEIFQYWHARYHHDPANQWLRAQFKSLFPA
ncbi:LysR family transcriptional regulator [Cupriavidus sp. DF5525]|uniref:LysR family transcriptional regulator n=1 Tax=Cupriavidus sp. DF5525 TaxID=3160989 RepID=UPI0003B0F400|nr:LysR family transcriptional regulator [Ralstonia pickettii DTP0602]